jgi:hypothetical protein
MTVRKAYAAKPLKDNGFLAIVQLPTKHNSHLRLLNVLSVRCRQRRRAENPSPSPFLHEFDKHTHSGRHDAGKR